MPEKVGTFDVGVTYHQDRVETSVNYFRSHLSNSITVDVSQARWMYQNRGDATFQGVEFEGKYYLKKDFFLLGSTLYQTNDDGEGGRNRTPIPNVGAKAGISYEGANGLTASVFDSYDGGVDGYAATLNPRPDAHHLVNALVRLNVSHYWHGRAGRSLALFMEADNVTNQQVWMPDWGGNTGDTIPVNRGRTLYFGVEMSLSKAATSVGR